MGNKDLCEKCYQFLDDCVCDIPRNDLIAEISDANKRIAELENEVGCQKHCYKLLEQRREETTSLCRELAGALETAEFENGNAQIILRQFVIDDEEFRLIRNCTSRIADAVQSALAKYRAEMREEGK